jgi:hypothetical protein
MRGFFAFLTILSTVSLACGSSNEAKNAGTNDTKTLSVAECSDLTKPARDRVEAAVEQNRACNVDADCVAVGASSACFDACSRSVAKSGEAAVEQAKSAASASDCKAFSDAGCKVIIPPCMPPTAPVCRGGKCE